MRTFITGRNGLVTLIVVMCIMTVRQPAAASADSSPAQNNTIYGCLESSSGRVRLIGDAQGACRPNETPISWNVLGPKGDTGPAGAPADMTQVTHLKNAVTNLQNQIKDLNGLLSRVANLENFNKWSHLNTVVDCGADQTVAAALAEAANYQSSTITIRGT